MKKYGKGELFKNKQGSTHIYKTKEQHYRGSSVSESNSHISMISHFESLTLSMPVSIDGKTSGECKQILVIGYDSAFDIKASPESHSKQVFEGLEYPLIQVTVDRI
jgi:hypothetical protein